MLHGHHSVWEVEWPCAHAESENCIEPPHNVFFGKDNEPQ